MLFTNHTKGLNLACGPLGLVVFLVLMTGGCGSGDEVEVQHVGGPVAAEGSGPVARAQVVEHLTEMGWTRTAATAVAEVGQAWFDQLARESGVAFQRQLVQLGRLGRDRSVQEFVSRHPETAGLFAGVVDVDAQAKETLLRVLVRFEAQSEVLSLFGISAAPEDALQLALALDRDGDLISELIRRDAWTAVPWFCRPVDSGPGQQVWRGWLRDLFRNALDSGQDGAVDRVQGLLTIHAPTVQQRLARSESFREAFLDRHWPAFIQILDQQTDDVAWGVFVSDPRVWAFFEKFGPDGVRLFEAHGPSAVELLTDPSYRTVQGQIVAALEHSDEGVIASLFDSELRNQPLFVQLLQRRLPGGSMAAALARLNSARDRIPQELEYFAGLDDAVLIEALGPPPSGPQTWLPGYGFYYMSRRFMSGQRVSGLDVALTVAETALDVIPGGRGASAGLKTIQKAVTKGLAKRGVAVAGKAAGQASSAALYPWVLREGFASARRVMTKLASSDQVDVTPLVRLAFESSGIGRATFRRFTNLEARVFMRADRRVVVNLAKLAGKDHVVGRIARETVRNAAADMVNAVRDKVVSRDETSERVAKVAVETASQVRDESGRRHPLLNQAWKRHLATWWLACALGEIDDA